MLPVLVCNCFFLRPEDFSSTIYYLKICRAVIHNELLIEVPRGQLLQSASGLQEKQLPATHSCAMLWQHHIIVITDAHVASCLLYLSISYSENIGAFYRQLSLSY